MNSKTLTIILGMIFLVGILITGVSADEYAGTVDNISGIYINDFIAGSTTTANFSFDYHDYYGNKQYSHVLQINISSNDTQYPVWKGDFELNGFVRKYTFFKMFHEDIELECSEISPLTIDHPLGLNTLDVPNGTFYCYNTTSEAIDNLDKQDEVYLTIKSHPALWPGQYSLSVGINYLEDTKAPIVNILNEEDFENIYYRENDNFNIQALVEEASEISNVWGTVYLDEENISFYSYDNSDGTYYFSTNTPSDIAEGNYELKIFAEDTSGNVGNDSTTLMIDRTGPNVELAEPIDGIYSEIIPIKFNVTDERAGVNNEGVQARLREIKEGIGLCPETGGPINGTGCITTPWINLTLVDDLFKVDVNTTYYNLTSGSYWLEARASDILGNEANWIA